MSARKPLALALLISGLAGTTVHADPITWPSGLNNWTIFLAGPRGTAGTGAVNYTAPPLPVIAPQAVPLPSVSTPPAALAPAVSDPPAPSQPIPAPVPTYTAPAPSPLDPVQPPAYVPPAPPQPVAAQVPSYTPPASPQSVAAQVPSYTPPAVSQPVAVPVPSSAPATSQPSMVQAVTYIHPASSQPSSVQPVMYTPPTLLSNAASHVTQPVLMAQTVSAVAPAPTASASPSTAQAFINVGSGPYPLAAAITTGGAQPWYNSAQVANLFGGQPNAQQIQSFDNAILQKVQQTFNQSGISVALTENPSTPALHTISLVSNTASGTLSSAIGMTQVGGNGFSFIDQIAPSAHSLDQLEWIAAHNISHELMLAFGVPENYDKSGNFIDSKLADWSMMVNPNSTFSSDASQAIAQALSSSQGQAGYTGQLGAQEVNPSAIPEPTTVAIWGLAALAIAASRRFPWRRANVPSAE